MSQEAEPVPPAKAKLRCRSKGNMVEWLAKSGGSLAITTYTSGKLVFVTSFNNRLRFRTHHFARPMGIASSGDQLAIAVREAILLFRRRVGSRHDNSQNAFALQTKYETGKIDAHDVAFGERGIYFANTRYNCVARASPSKRFLKHWQPKFIDGMTRGDRCHLNGIGVRDQRPRMATAFCATGQKGGWREQDRFTGGVMIDISRNEVVAEGLCMPHSPRWHDGAWWICNSGLGLLSRLDPESGVCQAVCKLPGFTRGLSFVGDHALVGLSRIRKKHILDAPPIKSAHKKIFAGVALVNWKTGQQVGALEFLDGGREVYDVIFLPDLRRPSLVLTDTASGRLAVP